MKLLAVTQRKISMWERLLRQGNVSKKSKPFAHFFQNLKAKFSPSIWLTPTYFYSMFANCVHTQNDVGRKWSRLGKIRLGGWLVGGVAEVGKVPDVGEVGDAGNVGDVGGFGEVGEVGTVCKAG